MPASKGVLAVDLTRLTRDCRLAGVLLVSQHWGNVALSVIELLVNHRRVGGHVCEKHWRSV